MAQAVIFDRRPPKETVRGGLGDSEQMRRLLGARAGDKRYMDGVLEKVHALVHANLVPIKRVAKALIQKGSLTPPEVRRAFGDLALVMA